MTKWMGLYESYILLVENNGGQRHLATNNYVDAAVPQTVVEMPSKHLTLNPVCVCATFKTQLQ